MGGIDYKSAGVDIDAGNLLVERIKPAVKATFRPNVLGNIGSFAGAFELPEGFKKPVLLSATDGVGTKLKLAIESGRLDDVGVDLVAMCVNDLICSRAEPLFFLDYYATGALNVDDAARVIKGIAKGCTMANCSLVGGESAEMPGMYQKGDFDLAGFSVGVVEKEELLKESGVKEGDALVALPSSGVHSNGYSLVRKLFFERLGHKFEEHLFGEPLIDTLMRPTHIYVKQFLQNRSRIKALSHITGGGLLENLPRSLPEGLGAVCQKAEIPKQPIFEFLLEHMAEQEAYRTFNMGVGMVLVCGRDDADTLARDCGGVVFGEVSAKSGVAII